MSSQEAASFLFEYKRASMVDSLHELPRFGHSNSFANLISDDDRRDYVHGLAALAIFFSSFVFVWIIVLIVLKFCYGVERVGCGAGGGIVNVDVMRKQRISRNIRKNRIIRNWRLQNVFFISCIGLSALSFMFVNRGMEPFMASLTQVDEISNKVDSNAYIGIDSVKTLTELVGELNTFASVDFLQTYCPNYENSVWSGMLQLESLQDELKSSVQGANEFVQSFAGEALSSLQRVTETTDSVAGAVDWVYNNDWFVKAFLIILNIVNGFFIFGVFLTKNNIDYFAFQAMMSYLMLPVFSIVTTCSLVATCAFVILAAANADFCSGGQGKRSPIGTFQDIALELGYNQTSPVFRALDYYSSNCAGEDPFALLADVKSTVTSTHRSVSQLLMDLNTTSQEFDLENECGADMDQALGALSNIEKALQNMRGTVMVALGLTDCRNLAPIIRLVNHGMACSESIRGSTWMFSCAYGIVIMCMVILTTRAALFNPLIKGKRRKRREREFSEYRDYMAQYYDTSTWKMDPTTGLLQGKILALETFESEATDKTDDDELISPHSTASRPDSFKTAEDDGERTELQTIIEMEGESVIGKLPGPAPAPETADDAISYYSADSEYDGDESVALSISTSVSAFVSFISGSILSLRGSVRRSRATNIQEEETIALNDAAHKSDSVKAADEEEREYGNETEEDEHSAAGSVMTSLSDLVGKYFRTKDDPEENRVISANDDARGKRLSVKEMSATFSGKSSNQSSKEESSETSQQKEVLSQSIGEKAEMTPNGKVDSSGSAASHRKEAATLATTPQISRDAIDPLSLGSLAGQEVLSDASSDDLKLPSSPKPWLNAPRKVFKSFARTSGGAE